jgi:soluble cytochrome b562
MTHIKDDALDLALEALEKSIAITMANINLRNKAITAIKQARALDKMAENARELGLDYEPAKYSDIVSDGGMDPRNQFDAPPPAQPAPVQPAHISPKQLLALAQEANLGLDKVIEMLRIAVQPAVPDAITDDSESPEYRTGWNDCRAEMLKGMK